VLRFLLPMRPGDVVLSYMSSGQLDPIRIYLAALHQNKSENYCLPANALREDTRRSRPFCGLTAIYWGFLNQPDKQMLANWRHAICDAVRTR